MGRATVTGTATSHAPGPPPERPPATVIDPPRGWRPVDARELWRSRELIFFLAWRDVKVRYKQTVLGAAWAVFQQAMMVAVFSVVFARMARVSSAGLPYPLFAYAGILAWSFFSGTMGRAGGSVVASSSLVTKVYFPRLAIPIASMGAPAIDFGVGLGVLVALMAYYGVAPGPAWFLAPLILAIIATMALGLGILLAALNVTYRDVGHVIPFLVQIGMFATPTIYMQPEVPPKAPATATATADPGEVPARGPAKARTPTVVRALLDLNPMTSLITAFRAALLGGTIPWARVGIASAWAAVALVAGSLYFRRVEADFADII